MRMIAAILGCPFHLSIFPLENAAGEQVESMEEVLLKYVKHPRVQPRRKKAEKEDMYQQVLVFDQGNEKESAMKADLEESHTAETDLREDGAAAMRAAKADSGKEKSRDAEKAAADQREAGKYTAGTETGEAETLEWGVLAAEDSEELTEIEEQGETEASVSETRQADSPSPVVSGHSDDGMGVEEERDITIGELYKIHEELDELENARNASGRTGTKKMPDNHVIQRELEERQRNMPGASKGETPKRRKPPQLRPDRKEQQQAELPGADSPDFEPVIHYEDAAEDLELGEMNPYTGREYQTNSVRMHPVRIGYVQVYDRAQHGWTDMTEWAFLGYQERKKALLGKDYEPPIYLD